MTISLDGYPLPNDLRWTDEFGFSQVSQSIEKTLTGALIIEEASQAKGRLITLFGGDDASWITKADGDILLAKTNLVLNTMVLNFHGTTYNVMFVRQGTNSPVQVTPIVDYSDAGADDKYAIVLKLIEV